MSEVLRVGGTQSTTEGHNCVVVLAVIIEPPAGLKQKEEWNKPTHRVPRLWVNHSPACGACLLVPHGRKEPPTSSVLPWPWWLRWGDGLRRKWARERPRAWNWDLLLGFPTQG